MHVGYVQVHVDPLHDPSLRAAGLYGKRRKSGRYSTGAHVALFDLGDAVQVCRADTGAPLGRVNRVALPGFLRAMRSFAEQVKGDVSWRAELSVLVRWNEDDETDPVPTVEMFLTVSDPMGIAWEQV